MTAPMRMSLEDWLDDLCVRFIVNIPASDASSVERMCFYIEEAQWYYEDFIRPLDPELPSLNLRAFCERIFLHCPALSKTGSTGTQAFEEFMMYKSRVPVRGTILLNEAMDSVVLVKGWKKGASWSFPRGKINQHEPDLDCAIRETLEETGFDLEKAGLVPEDRMSVHSIPFTMKEQDMRMFVFRDVPMDTHFETQTRKEIGAIGWWQLSDLPAFKKKGKQGPPQAGVKSNQFFMVAPFLAPLRRWVIDQKKHDAQRNQRSQASTHQHRGASNPQDFLTDEDPGTESQGPSFTDADVSEYDQDQVLDSTAIINRLFKGQQRPEDFMAAAPTPPPPPPPKAPVKKSGEALLALLHSNPVSNHQSPLRNAPLHTPLDQTMDLVPMPRNPHHQHSQHPQHPQQPQQPQHLQHPPPPPFAIMPPPPPFPPMGAPSESFSYQQQEVQYAQQRNNVRPRQVPPPQHSPRNQGPHPYQPQHLIHPQPLPPHVQRAVFTGGPVHAPMVPPPVQQPPPQFSGPVPVMVPSPQFPGLHAPMVPQEQQHTPPKLTKHSLALLDAFKRRDQADQAPPVAPPENLVSREFENPPTQPRRSQPQELPGDASQPFGAPYNQQGQPPEIRGAHVMDPNIFAARPPISENQRSTLLGLFKSPTTPNAVPVSATALPTSATPSAVELSAVEPLSENAATTSALLNDRREPSHAVKNAPIPEMNPELNLPYRARAILTRPSGANEEPPRRDGGYTRSPPKVASRRIPSQLPDPPSPKKVFQPQILKRPQSGSPQVTEHTTPTQTSYATFANALPEPRRAQPVSHMQPMVERQGPEHKQALLSLFGKSPSSMTDSQTMAKVPSTDRYALMQSPESNIGSSSTKSRVSNLATAEVPRRGSGSSMSPTDKGFLLGYLENVVKGV